MINKFKTYLKENILSLYLIQITICYYLNFTLSEAVITIFIITLLFLLFLEPSYELMKTLRVQQMASGIGGIYLVFTLIFVSFILIREIEDTLIVVQKSEPYTLQQLKEDLNKTPEMLENEKKLADEKKK